MRVIHMVATFFMKILIHMCDAYTRNPTKIIKKKSCDASPTDISEVCSFDTSKFNDLVFS